MQEYCPKLASKLYKKVINIRVGSPKVNWIISFKINTFFIRDNKGYFLLFTVHLLAANCWYLLYADSKSNHSKKTCKITTPLIVC